jgi:UDP-glucose 4-epimerase
MNIVVTGGAGYIGSHLCLELLCAGHQVVVVDNLCNSKEESLNRVQQLAGKQIQFIKADLTDAPALEEVFNDHPVDAVIHLAGLKAVAESIAMPLTYYHNNVSGFIVLSRLMQKYGIYNLVFSSSATIYGRATKIPLTEDLPFDAVNPYGRTKCMIEEILADLAAADDRWHISALRYFNPVGAHGSGRIGDAPSDTPKNLFPCISQVAVGARKELLVYGGDYPTRDGTCIRDYIHVIDLAAGHLRALEKLPSSPAVSIYNLGTGHGVSVLEAVSAFENASGRKIPFKVVERRPGDVAANYADPSKAHRELGWKANLDLQEMCTDTWRWQSQNPNGYE